MRGCWSKAASSSLGSIGLRAWLEYLPVVHACAMHGGSHGDIGCEAALTGTCAGGAQFNSASLNRHLSQAYNANVGGYSSRGFVEVWPARQAP